MEFIDLKEQYRNISEKVQTRIQTVFDHGRYIMGPEITELEGKLAEFTGSKHSVCVSSGTDALIVALMAIGVKNGDEVITAPFTFIATAEAIAILGAKPVFVEIDPKTYNINPALLENAITGRTKAIIPVSLFGQCADCDAINVIAKKHNLHVIEDGAQSFGATYHGKRSCALTEIGVTSFFPAKPLGCYGDGGACFTDDDDLALKMRQILNHGQDRRYNHAAIGLNGRMDTLQAAVLLEKLAIFPEELKSRARIGARYTELLNGSVVVPYMARENTHVYAQYTIQVYQRDNVCARLNEQGIPTAIHYPIALHQQPAFSYLGYAKGEFPVSEQVSAQVMSLPMHPYLPDDDQDRIVDAVKEAVS